MKLEFWEFQIEQFNYLISNELQLNSATQWETVEAKMHKIRSKFIYISFRTQLLATSLKCQTFDNSLNSIITLVPLSRFSSSKLDLITRHCSPSPFISITQIQTCVVECPEKLPLVFKEVVKWCLTWQPLILWHLNRVLEIPMKDLWVLMAQSE